MSKFVLPLGTLKFSEEELLTMKKLAKAGDFCGCCYKHKTEVKRIISIPDSSICNECVDLLNEMLNER